MTEKHMNKKELSIFLLTAYGVTYLMGLLMWYGGNASIDLSAFPNAQMMYPAAGVMLAYLLEGKGKRQVPGWFFMVFLLLTGVLIGVSVLSVVMPEKTVIMPGGEISVWMTITQLVLIGGSIFCWIALLVDGKVRRRGCGPGWKNGKAPWLCMLLFNGALFSARRYRVCVERGRGCFAGAFRTEDGRADPGRCVGTVAPALRFLLLCDTGEGIDHDGNTDYHLCESWHLLCLGVQEDRQSLGTGNSALYEQQSGAVDC